MAMLRPPGMHCERRGWPSPEPGWESPLPKTSLSPALLLPSQVPSSLQAYRSTSPQVASSGRSQYLRWSPPP